MRIKGIPTHVKITHEVHVVENRFLQVIFGALKVSSVSLVTVNPLEFNSLPNSSSAAIPSISDVDVFGSCFLNKIDLEEQDTQQRKNIKSKGHIKLLYVDKVSTILLI